MQAAATMGQKTDWKNLISRGLETAVGGVLLVAGILKAWEPVDFARQIGEYNIISDQSLITVVAWLAIILECGIGMALIAGYRRLIFVPAAAGLITIFLGLVGYAWASGSTQDCGCFGSWVKRTPAEAFAEDAVLLIAIVAAGFLNRIEPATYKKLRMFAVQLAVVAGLGLTIYSTASPRQSTDSVLRLKTSAPSPFLGVPVSGISVDLTIGTHLVALVDTGCSHCQKAVPQFNQIYEKGSKQIPIVGICSNSAPEMATFIHDFNVEYPLGSIPREDLMRLLDGGGTPRTLLVKDGEILKVWDGEIPAPGDAERFLSSPH